MTDPWAAPDSPPEPAGRPTGPWPPDPAGGRRPSHDRPEPPVPLRRMTMADRIDGALRILKLAPGTVLALTAVAVAPFEVLAAMALHGDDAPLVRTFLGSPLTALITDDTGAGLAGPLLFLFLDALVVAFVAAGMASLVGSWYVGRRPGSAEVLRAAAGRLPALVAAMAIVHGAEAVGSVVLLVPALIPMVLGAVVAPVIGAEWAGPVAALRRSFQLTRRAWGLVLSTCLLVALACLILRLALGAAAGLYAALEWPAAATVATVAAVAARLVTVPLVAGTAVLLYFDLRVRHEGLDIDLAIAERLPGAS